MKLARILIVEDEIDQAELYRMALEHAGHEVVGAGGDLDLALRAGEKPDLIILDERLRGRSGTAFIPTLRKTYPAARILLVTADPDAAEAAPQHGADRGVRKPVPLAQLVMHIQEILAGR